MVSARMGASQDTEGKRRKVDLDLYLRSPQAEYLERLMERRATDLSSVVRELVKQKMSAGTGEQKQSPRKVRKHIVIAPRLLAFVDAMAAREGLMRADVFRRLIDEARANEPTF